MAEKEVNTIAHLLEVEQKAAAMTMHAQEDADKKIAQAKAKADSEFKAEYEKIVKECESTCENKIAFIIDKKNKSVSDYKTLIKASALDKAAFFSYLDSLFFA